MILDEKGINTTYSGRFNAFLATLDFNNLKYKIIETYRNDEKQADYYKQGREIPGNVITNARPGESYHNYGAALDLVPIDKNGKVDFTDAIAYFEMGVAASKHGLEWGGSWKSLKDSGHFQIPSKEISIDELKLKYPLA